MSQALSLSMLALVHWCQALACDDRLDMVSLYMVMGEREVETLESFTSTGFALA